MIWSLFARFAYRTASSENRAGEANFVVPAAVVGGKTERPSGKHSCVMSWRVWARQISSCRWVSSGLTPSNESWK